MELLNWWSVAQSARYLNISEHTIRLVIAKGRVRAVQTAIGLLVDPESVREYERTRQPLHQKRERAETVSESAESEAAHANAVG
jgi:hypothetical protein